MAFDGGDYKGSWDFETRIRCIKSKIKPALRRDLRLRTLDFGYWTLDIGLWILDLGLWTLDIGPWTVFLEVTIVSDDLPVEQHILNPRPGADVMHDQTMLV